MKLQNIVSAVNEKLAGESLVQSQLLLYLDDVIDDINTRLDTNYPSFSEFIEYTTNTNGEKIYTYSQYPNYNFFPDKYIRSVVIPGAAYKFYITDEEGAMTAQMYGTIYETNSFYMVRDYSEKVPAAFRNAGTGYLNTCDGAQTNEACMIGGAFRELF